MLGRVEDRLTVVQAFGGCRPQCRLDMRDPRLDKKSHILIQGTFFIGHTMSYR